MIIKAFGYTIVFCKDRPRPLNLGKRGNFTQQDCCTIKNEEDLGYLVLVGPDGKVIPKQIDLQINDNLNMTMTATVTLFIGGIYKENKKWPPFPDFQFTPPPPQDIA